MTDTPFETHDYILEGGSIDTDGRDTLLTTEHCLLNKNRNPSLSRAEIESKLKHWLGMKQIIWLGDGLEGDDTDGHVDDLSRFVAPGVVVTAIEKDPQDTNFAPLKDNWERLQKAKDSRGQPLRVLELPMPPRSDGPHHRNPASHANFYIANSAVLVPVFNSPTDRPTLDLLRPFFPDRKMVGIDCSALVGGLGAIHCITQQMPAIPA
jgi:agmatine deiminase